MVDFIDITRLALGDRIIVETDDGMFTFKVIGPNAAITEIETTSRTFRWGKPVVGQVLGAYESDEFQLKKDFCIVKDWHIRIKFDDASIITEKVRAATIEGATGWTYEVF